MSSQNECEVLFPVKSGIFGVGRTRNAPESAYGKSPNRRVAYWPLAGLEAHRNPDQLCHARGRRARQVRFLGDRDNAAPSGWK